MKTSVSAALVLVLACAGPALAQQQRGLVWDDRPSIVFGEDVKLDLRAKLQFDWRKFDPQIDEDAFDFRREVSVVIHEPALVKRLNMAFHQMSAKAGAAASLLPGDRIA